jgi:hypothetical protein
MKEYAYISLCGIDCNKCLNYKKNVNCAGCRDEKVLLEDCPTRVCAIEKGFLHCGECETFPCEELNKFYHSGNPNHLKAYENIKSFIEES